LSRLLGDYPPERITIVTTEQYDSLATVDGQLAADKIVIRTTNKNGRWGWGRLKAAYDIACLPYWMLWTLRLIKERRIGVVLTVAHGLLFFVAVAAARSARVPSIVLVHDDWLVTWGDLLPPLKPLLSVVYKHCLRSASQVYCMSEYMQRRLSEWGVNSDVQLHAREADISSDRPFQAGSMEHMNIAYAGTFTGAMQDGLELLLKLICSEKMTTYNLKSWHVHAYAPEGSFPGLHQAKEKGRLTLHGWVSQAALAKALAEADALFLPLSFKKDQQEMVTTAFPCKTSDYLAAKRPIVVLAPPYAALTAYSRQHGLAIVVDRLDETALADALGEIAHSEFVRHQLTENAARTFAKNHNIVTQREELYLRIRDLVHAALNAKVKKVQCPNASR